MDRNEIQQLFTKIISEDEDISVGVAAIMTLMEFIKRYKPDTATIQGLVENLETGISVMKSSNYPVAAINSGCQLFLMFITFARLDTNSFEECREIMLDRGNLFLKNLNEARGKIAKSACKFITDGCKVLTHSRSRVVLKTLKEAAKQNKNFEVYVTESEPDKTGLRMCKDLESEGIPCITILDSAVGYIMEQVDFVMVGAEGVVESGGIVNKLGSYTMAIIAKEMKKPFYVLTESFKFSRLFPLNQQDLPMEYKFTNPDKVTDLKKQHPLVDYTPPSYITLLFTDLGILTPSAVSDELIKLYL